jgi:hypothetical protein
MIYQVVAARRQQWDNLVWQVSALSLTAQAFLLTIALGGPSSQPARLFASFFSVVVSFLCITLMTRHRQSEIHDANWLASFENKIFRDLEQSSGLREGPAPTETRCERICGWLTKSFRHTKGAEAAETGELTFRVHGLPFRGARQHGRVDGGWTEYVPLVRPYKGYQVWIGGLLLFWSSESQCFLSRAAQVTFS